MWSFEVKEIPEKIDVTNRTQVDVKKFLQDILDNHLAKYEKIEWYADYCSVQSAYHSIHATIKVQGYPIKLHVRGEELYLERQDI